jgi:hypothetical protein
MDVQLARLGLALQYRRPVVREQLRLLSPAALVGREVRVAGLLVVPERRQQRLHGVRRAGAVDTLLWLVKHLEVATRNRDGHARIA